MGEKQKFRPDRILDYFRREKNCLIAITIFGLIYNIGLLAGPWFEGKMAGCLTGILGHTAVFSDMLRLVLGYALSTIIVQMSRYLKRFYVRRFANNVNRSMKAVLYGSLVRMGRAKLEQEDAGTLITKAVADVDDCAEGMRKFTTEVFDTGVAMIGYMAMLFWYDWKLALLCMLFPPVSYILAEHMKKIVQQTGAAYKKQAGALSAATLDRASNAVTYRVFGCEEQRMQAYEIQLTSYEKAAVKANIWSTSLPPLYQVVCMISTLMILTIGSQNVLGSGWSTWDIAVFTTFLSCYTKLAVKSSKAAKLFNAVHRAQVSWNRIRPMMKDAPAAGSDGEQEKDRSEAAGKRQTNGQAEFLTVSHLSFAFPDGQEIFHDVSFQAQPGQIIGITGPVACGKSTLGKAFLCEYPYQGSIQYGGREVAGMPEEKRSLLFGYLGHDPELLSDTIEKNVRMGAADSAEPWLSAVCLDQEISEMENKEQTMVGDGGVRLSGGQAKRLALARTLCTHRPVLILDDPFSALDKNTEEEIFANLKQLAKDQIVLLISHRLYLFPQMDQVIWMENGCARTADHETLMREEPEYASLYRDQTIGKEEEQQ